MQEGTQATRASTAERLFQWLEHVRIDAVGGPRGCRGSWLEGIPQAIDAEVRSAECASREASAPDDADDGSSQSDDGNASTGAE